MDENKENWNEESIKIGHAGDIYVYKIKELELHILEKGSPGSIYLNVALALLPTAVALVASLVLTPPDSFWIAVGFTSTAIAFGFAGAVFLCLWFAGRNEAGRVAREIRERAEGDSARGRAPPP